jgi:peptidyl-prolyl cis-trans isomerase C
MRKLFVLLCCCSGPALAADGALLRVGPEQADAAAVARALERVPVFQLRELGTNDAERRRAVVERRLVPELRAAAEAKARGLHRKPEVQARVRELQARVFEEKLARDAALARPVTDAEVKQYFEQNRQRFDTPQRIRVWRILVKDEALARRIIAQAHGREGPKRWSDFAREHSLDTATKLRDGDLGFVRPDGSTEAPRVRVDPAIFKAVERLRDGEIAREPLAQGENFAVLWRRGSLPPVTRSLEQETSAIRTLLTRERREQARAELLSRLRKEHLEVHELGLLETLPDSAFEMPAPEVTAAKPQPSPTLPKASAVTPTPGERGTR